MSKFIGLVCGLLGAVFAVRGDAVAALVLGFWAGANLFVTSPSDRKEPQP